MTKEFRRIMWERSGFNIDTECTCNNCPHGETSDTCLHAYSIYNRDGDCERATGAVRVAGPMNCR